MWVAVDGWTGESCARAIAKWSRKTLVRPVALSPFSSQTMRRFLSTPNAADLLVLKDLVDTGRLQPAIDRCYGLDETVAALRHIKGGHARGKVVLSVFG